MPKIKSWSAHCKTHSRLSVMIMRHGEKGRGKGVTWATWSRSGPIESCTGRSDIRIQGMQKNFCMFEIALLLPTNPGQLMDSQSALPELRSPNLAGTFLYDAVFWEKSAPRLGRILKSHSIFFLPSLALSVKYALLLGEVECAVFARRSLTRLADGWREEGSEAKMP